MKKHLKGYGIITLGSMLFALSFDWFFAPNQVAMAASPAWPKSSMCWCPGPRWAF